MLSFPRVISSSRNAKPGTLPHQPASGTEACGTVHQTTGRIKRPMPEPQYHTDPYEDIATCTNRAKYVCRTDCEEPIRRRWCRARPCGWRLPAVGDVRRIL